MPGSRKKEPWQIIGGLVKQGNSDELDAYLETLTPGEVARAISLLGEQKQAALVTLLEPEDAADLIEELPDAQGADIIEDLDAEAAAAIIDEMESDHRADILGEMTEGDAEAILRRMDPEEAKEARELLAHDPQTAGGIMVTEFVVFEQGQQVGDVLKDLQTNRELYSDLGVQYAYVASESGTMLGVLRLRDLVLSASDVPIRDVMIVNPISVLVNAPLEEVEQFFDRYMFSGLPVINEEGQILGVVQRADTEEALSERSDRTFLQFSGIIGGDELRSMPLSSRSGKRLWWLGLNLILSVLASFVIIYYEETVKEVIFLAVLIPVLVNVSGCSGNQAIAVTIREMTLGLLKPRDLLRVVRKEVGVGIINGIVLGAILALFAYLREGDPRLGLVVGAALAVNTLLAVAVGGTLPLILRRFNIDPAVAAAPMLTTVIDMSGFFLILSLATAFLV